MRLLLEKNIPGSPSTSLTDTSNTSSIANSNGNTSPSASISNSANELTLTLSASAILRSCSGFGMFFPSSYLRIATSCIPQGRGKKKLDIAENFIKEFFGLSKEIASNDILQEAAKRGIKRNTLLSAKKKLGITSGKGKLDDGTSFWTWIMPDERV